MCRFSVKVVSAAKGFIGLMTLTENHSERSCNITLAFFFSSNLNA